MKILLKDVKRIDKYTCEVISGTHKGMTYKYNPPERHRGHFITQPFVHRETKEIVKLARHALKHVEWIYWTFINEEGELFIDDLDNYDVIINFLGERVHNICGDAIWSTLKEFVHASDEVRAEREANAPFEKAQKTLEYLKKNGHGGGDPWGTNIKRKKEVFEAFLGLIDTEILYYSKYDMPYYVSTIDEQDYLISYGEGFQKIKRR